MKANERKGKRRGETGAGAFRNRGVHANATPAKVDRGVQGSRMRTAFLLVAALVGAVPVVDMALGAAGGQKADDACQASVKLAAAPLAHAQDPEAALDEIERQLQEAGSRQLPDGFQDEIGILDGAREVCVDSSQCVVGWVVSGGEQEALSQMEQLLQPKGWTAVPLGQVTGATFVKKEGTYQWLLVTCTQVGDDTSVVARVVKS